MKEAHIETRESSGEVRVTFGPQAFEGRCAPFEMTSLHGTAHPDDGPLSPDHWEHLVKAYGDGSRAPLFVVEPFVMPPLCSGAAGVRRSAVEALAHRGYVTLLRVKQTGRMLAWAAPITPAGKRVVEECRRAQPPAGGLVSRIC